MRCSHCGAERLKNITVQGESCTCKHCGAEFTVQTSADGDRSAVVFCSRLPKPGRGGVRANAGRKAAHGEAKRDKNIALTPTLWAFLVRDGETAGHAIESHYRKTAAFKAWMKSMEEV